MILMGNFYQRNTSMFSLYLFDIFEKFIDNKLQTDMESDVLGLKGAGFRGIIDSDKDIENVITPSEEKGFKLFKKATHYGNLRAMSALAICYEDGKGVQQNAAKGYSLRYEAAQRGDSVAKKYFIRKDETRTKQYYLEHASSISGVEFLLFIFPLLDDKKFAYELTIKLSEVENKCFGSVVALAYNKFGEYSEAEQEELIKSIKKMARSGNVLTQYWLGMFYYEGHMTLSQDYENARYWLQKLTSLNSPKVFYRLGCCYYDPRGITKDYKKAIYWWNKAANAGSADAEYELGKCYYNGTGVAKSPTMAGMHWNRAYTKGHNLAKYILSLTNIPLDNPYGFSDSFKKLLEMESADRHPIAQRML